MRPLPLAQFQAEGLPSRHQEPEHPAGPQRNCKNGRLWTCLSFRCKGAQGRQCRWHHRLRLPALLGTMCGDRGFGSLLFRHRLVRAVDSNATGLDPPQPRWDAPVSIPCRAHQRRRGRCHVPRRHPRALAAASWPLTCRAGDPVHALRGRAAPEVHEYCDRFAEAPGCARRPQPAGVSGQSAPLPGGARSAAMHPAVAADARGVAADACRDAAALVTALRARRGRRVAQRDPLRVSLRGAPAGARTSMADAVQSWAARAGGLLPGNLA
mmetsp:Transcript_107492/g.285996  ORF Transcript_107492/g.285996 Transcript_107492/m.285996 type:complete len:268 (+) Transcript_107492:501-1304(+)